MNREIKFRIWYKGRMAYTPLVGMGIFHFVNKDADNFKKDSIIMQYTGLLDRSGKEIYEGDICKFNSGETSDVVFKDGEFQNRLSKWGLHIYMKCPYTGEQIAPGIEIIGNLHENPNLITA